MIFEQQHSDRTSHLVPKGYGFGKLTLGRCGVCPYVLKARIMSALVLLAGAFSVVWLRCARTGLGLRDMRFSTGLTDKHSRNLRKKFQVSFHGSVLLAAFPFYLVPTIQTLLPVASGIVSGQGIVLIVV